MPTFDSLTQAYFKQQMDAAANDPKFLGFIASQARQTNRSGLVWMMIAEQLRAGKTIFIPVYHQGRYVDREIARIEWSLKRENIRCGIEHVYNTHAGDPLVMSYDQFGEVAGIDWERSRPHKFPTFSGIRLIPVKNHE